MRGVSLWQPWASLCFVAEPTLRKLDETRHWQYPARLGDERIAIQAAVYFPRNLDEDLIAVCEAALGVNFWSTLPAGAILGTVRLGQCRPTGEVRDTTTEANRHAGDFSDFTIVKGVQRRRYAWALHEPQPLGEPIPFRGAQGFFEVPDALLGVTPPIAAQGGLFA